MATYDAIVIGAGQPGPGVAGALADDGKRVALIEMDRAGGTCLNHGCKPTKALRASAAVAHQARRAAEYGVRTGEITVDFPAAMTRMRSIIDGLRDSLDGWLGGVAGLDQFHGTATVTTDPAGQEHRVGVEDQELTTGQLYLNLGARASRPPMQRGTTSA